MPSYSRQPKVQCSPKDFGIITLTNPSVRDDVCVKTTGHISPDQRYNWSLRSHWFHLDAFIGPLCTWFHVANASALSTIESQVEITASDHSIKLVSGCRLLRYRQTARLPDTPWGVNHDETSHKTHRHRYSCVHYANGRRVYR